MQHEVGKIYTYRGERLLCQSLSPYDLHTFQKVDEQGKPVTNDASNGIRVQAGFRLGWMEDGQTELFAVTYLNEQGERKLLCENKRDNFFGCIEDAEGMAKHMQQESPDEVDELFYPGASATLEARPVLCTPDGNAINPTFTP